MSKVLVVYDSGKGPTLAVMDSVVLAGYPLTEMHRKDANSPGLRAEVRDYICELGQRLGLEESMDGPEADLKGYIIDNKTPFYAVSVVICSWMP